MKKTLLIVTVSLFGMAVNAQRVTNNKTLKTTDLGNQRLEVYVSGSDTAYSISLASGHRTRVEVALGGTDAALKLLQWLADYEPKRGDIVEFENETRNVAKWEGASGYLVYSEGRAFSGHLRKPNIKGFIKAINDFAGR
jgi:hypothetical protein